jgi:hypothetical protein
MGATIVSNTIKLPPASKIYSPQSTSAENGHFHTVKSWKEILDIRVEKFFVHVALTANAIWYAINSLVPRIRYIQSNKLDQYLRFGKEVEVRPDQTLAPNKRTHARIRDTQLLQKNLPWVSMVDCHLFLEGWTQGCEFGLHNHNHDFCSPLSDKYGIGSSSPEPPSQFSNLSNDQTSSTNPAAIAGVTHKLE